MMMTASEPRQPVAAWSRVRRALDPAWRGLLWRTRPASEEWGFDRGTPVDRYYIEAFLQAHTLDIRGRVLEVANADYTERFGKAVETRDVLDIDPANPRATLIADLAAAHQIPTGLFDCFILTQTLHIIYDVRAALAHAHRILRPGGVLLATLPSLSRISGRLGPDRDYWRFTPGSARQLFGEVFGDQHVQVNSAGNTLAAVAFLAGLAVEDLTPRELDVQDPLLPVIVSVRAVKGT